MNGEDYWSLPNLFDKKWTYFYFSWADKKSIFKYQLAENLKLRLQPGSKLFFIKLYKKNGKRLNIQDKHGFNLYCQTPLDLWNVTTKLFSWLFIFRAKWTDLNSSVKRMVCPQDYPKLDQLQESKLGNRGDRPGGGNGRGWYWMSSLICSLLGETSPPLRKVTI